jgi:hypothetical protein
VTAVALGVAVLLSLSEGAGLDVYIGNMLLYGSAWLVGDNRRVSRAYTRELEARAERLERDREAEAVRRWPRNAAGSPASSTTSPPARGR